jgi:serine/threonine protein phosphatase PrpC
LGKLSFDLFFTPNRFSSKSYMTLNFKVRPANAQHKGNRDSQQDAFGFSLLSDAEFAKHGGVLAVIADGMGGMENGVWASTQAIRLFIEAYANKSPTENISIALLRSMRMANAVVYQEAMRLDLMENMGTTLVAAVVKDGELHWVNSGDSRVYLYEAGIMTCLSTDHNYFNQNLAPMIAAGKLSLSEAQTNPKRDLLTSNLGRPEPIEVGYAKTPLRVSKGAWILLCSDGLTDTLSDAEIASHLQGDPQLACDKLIASVLEKSIRTQDNTTVVVLHLAADEQVKSREIADRNISSGKAPAGSVLTNATVHKIALTLASLCVAAAATLYFHPPSPDPSLVDSSVDVNSIPIPIAESGYDRVPASPVTSEMALPEQPSISSMTSTAKPSKQTETGKMATTVKLRNPASATDKSTTVARLPQAAGNAETKSTEPPHSESDEKKVDVVQSNSLKETKDPSAEIVIKKLEDSKENKNGVDKENTSPKDAKKSESSTEKKAKGTVEKVSKTEKKDE